jgi:predicted nucleic acid-binding protein
MTVVVDGSALAVAVTDTTARGDRVRAQLDDGAVAPHLVDAEVGQAIRGLVLRGLLDAEAAERSLAAAEQLVAERFPHPPLRGRAWQLRSNVSFYDGLYVALAETVRLPLLTADAKLVGAHGPRCQLELV